MPGRMDEISRSIGGLEEGVSGLRRTFDQHCQDDDKRHHENVSNLRELMEKMDELKEAVTPLVSTVAIMKPIVDGYQISRWKLAGVVSFVGILLTVFGWLISAGAAKMLHWIGSILKL